jgi:hypothetical protein
LVVTTVERSSWRSEIRSKSSSQSSSPPARSNGTKPSSSRISTSTLL